MKGLRRKWRWIACVSIALLAIAAVTFGPPIVQFTGGLLGLFAILAVIISGNDGGEGGQIPPWYGGGGSGGGL